MKLILAGGGGAEASKKVDEYFLNLVDTGKVLYLPIAMPTEKHNSCQKWFSETFSRLGFSNFNMWSDVSDKSYEDLREFSAVYIGGGNTYLLLDTLRQTGFDKHLIKYAENGGITYGGSAGAIVLGSIIDTASFGNVCDKNEVGISNTNGLGLIGDYVVKCHYDESEKTELEDFCREKGVSAVALREESGLFWDNGAIQSIGSEPVYMFNPEDGTGKVLS